VDHRADVRKDPPQERLVSRVARQQPEGRDRAELSDRLLPIEQRVEDDDLVAGVEQVA
jgi:hypothetical protein